MKEESEALGKNRLVRCNFWPMCDKGDECAYLHPNKPCIMFPNCQYGQLCRYIHPICRYDGFCTRLDCMYMHVIKKPSLLASPITEPVEKEENLPSSTRMNSDETKDENQSNLSPMPFAKPLAQTKYLYPFNQYNLVNNRTNNGLLNSIQINCKYDNLCKNPNCIFLHTNSLPPKSQLKWRATSALTMAGESSKLEGLEPNNEIASETSVLAISA